jgi:hypothetical protein
MTKLHFYSTLAVLTLLGLVGRALLVPGYFEDFDSLYFARSLEHYSVAALSPHWPGYPVFVWSIRLAHLFTPDPVVALHAVSVIAASVTAVPVALITFEIARLGQNRFGHAFETALEFGAGFSLERARIAGLIAAALWTLVPITWIDGTEALSDPLAGLVAALFLWACLRTLERPQPGWYALIGVFAGLLPGVRLAGILLLAPLGMLGWQAIRERRWSNLVWLLGSTVLTVSVWFGWQLSQEGLSWFSTGRQMLGHLSPDWVPEASESNLWGQLIRYAHRTLELGLGGGTLGALTDGNSRGLNSLSSGLLSGLSNWLLSFARPLISIGWVLALMAGAGVLLRGRQRPALVLLASMVLPHLIWVLRSRDLSSARYAIPIVLVLVIVAGLGIASIAGMRVGQNRVSPRPYPDAISGWRLVLSGLLISGWAALIATVTVPLALEHKTSLPIEQQIAAYLQPVSAAHPVTFFGTHSMLFWDAAQLPVDVVYAPLEVLKQHTGRPGEVFLTTIGTEKRTLPTTQPTAQPPKRWRAVAQFCRNRFLRARTRDPIELVLFQHLLEGQSISNLLPKRDCQDRTFGK